MKTTNHQMITIKKNSKMKTIKLNKNGKARQPRKLTKKQVEACGWQCRTKADLIKYICDNVGYLFRDELEEMLWKLANGR